MSAESQRRIVALASGLLAAGALFPFTAKPISWDELEYMGLAFYPEGKGYVLNRYAHVYAMKPFMWLAGDPYLGARLFWSFLIGVVAAALVSTTLRLPRPQRFPVFALTFFLLAGQETLFAYPGIAYADYTVMAVLTLAVCSALHPILEGREFSPRHAFWLGSLLFIGMKSKETALPLLLVVAILFLSPAGQLRRDQKAHRLAAYCGAGVLAGGLLLTVADGLFLGDPFFSLSPRSWWRVLRYNIRGEAFAPPTESWLASMLRPGNFAAFALYVATGLIWSRRRRDVRLLVLYAIPGLFLLMLTVLQGFVFMTFVRRYTIPILPLLCFFAAFGFSQISSEVLKPEAVRWRKLSSLGVAAFLAVVLLVAVGLPIERLDSVLSGDRLRIYVAPMLILSGWIALLFWKARPQLVVSLVLLQVFAAGLLPMCGVVVRLAHREVQSAGERRFAGFFDVARSVEVGRDARIFVSKTVYDRPSTAHLRTLTRMNFNLPLPADRIFGGDWPAPDVDYAVVSTPEYEAWLSAAPPDPQRAVVSRDGAIALLCLRTACPLRRPGS